MVYSSMNIWHSTFLPKFELNEAFLLVVATNLGTFFLSQIFAKNLGYVLLESGLS